MTARLPFDVGTISTISTTADTLSSTSTGFSAFSVISSSASPVPWINDWNSRPSISPIVSVAGTGRPRMAPCS